MAPMAARMAVVAAAASLMAVSACAGGRPKRVAYADYTLIIASPGDVDRACQVRAARWDDGHKPRYGEHTAGCWKADAREIWLRWDDVGARALPHELCHKDGKPDCRAYDWPD